MKQRRPYRRRRICLVALALAAALALVVAGRLIGGGAASASAAETTSARGPGDVAAILTFLQRRQSAQKAKGEADDVSPIVAEVYKSLAPHLPKIMYWMAAAAAPSDAAAAATLRAPALRSSSSSSSANTAAVSSSAAASAADGSTLRTLHHHPLLQHPYWTKHPNSGPAELQISFQPIEAPGSTEWLGDHGLLFGDRGGFAYGWTHDHSMPGITQRRKVHNSLVYDTMIHTIPGLSVWNIAVPNGRYEFTAVVGDPKYSGTHTLNVQGKSLFAKSRTCCKSKGGGCDCAGPSHEEKMIEIVVTNNKIVLDTGVETMIKGCKDIVKPDSRAGRLTLVKIRAVGKTMKQLRESLVPLSVKAAKDVEAGLPIDKYTGIRFSHPRAPITKLRRDAKYTLFGTPKPLHIGEKKNAGMELGRRQSLSHLERTFYNWAHMGSSMSAFMFSRDPKTRNWAESFGVLTSGEFEFNAKHKSPTYRGLFKAALRETSSSMVGLANSDILFGKDLVTTLDAVNAFAKAKNKVGKVFVVGMRYNSFVASDLKFNGVVDMEEKIQEMMVCGKGEGPWAQDYFFASRHLWNWDRIPAMVMGGLGADNWLVTKAKAMGSNGLAVDTSRTVSCIHQEHPVRVCV